MKIGVILSGCGVMDGSEIHEAALTLLAISKAGAEAVCMAPNVDQVHVINHLTGEEMMEKRNVLVEAARIARGKIQDLKTVKAGDIDAVVLPGGYGAAKNLCTFAFDGADCKVEPETARLVKEMHAAGKPVGAICIAPALIAKIFEGTGAKLTIGNEKEPADQIRKTRNTHVDCTVRETVIDKENRIVSTPAYMLAQNIAEAAAGIEKLVQQVIQLAIEPALRK
jgi:enhancing lycopene biosynthesis protein 2